MEVPETFVFERLEAGMGVRGKGTAFESPCPAQHCRNQ